MKLVTYLGPTGGARSGALLDDDRVLDLAGGAEACGLELPTSLLALLDLGKAGLERAAWVEERARCLGLPTATLDAVRLLAPLPRPRKVLAIAGNYVAHIEEGGGSKAPGKSNSTLRPFMKPSNAVIGPEAPIQYPRWSMTLDHEVELCVVVGRQATAVPAERAAEYIAGYAVFNDVSARSLTVVDGRSPRDGDKWFDWLVGKWFDSFAAFGPAIVTADSVPDPQDLAMRLDVNGERRQDASTAQMIFSCAEIVSYLSHITTLEPGDIIATGTPAGVAYASGRFLQVGDIVEATIEGLGTLRNPVAAGVDARVPA